MNRKNLGGIGATLAIILVILAFSGIASSDTSRQVLVSPEVPAWDELVSEAWNESVLVSDAWNESVLVSDAWNESVLVSEAQDGTVDYSDVPFNTVEEWSAWIWAQPHSTGGWGRWNPVYVTVVDQEAYDEQVLVQEAYDETIVDQEAYDEQVLVTPAYDEQVSVEADHSGHYLNAAGQIMKPGNYNAQKYQIGTVKFGYKVVDDTGCGVNKIWKPIYTTKTVHHDAVYQTVHHDAVTHIVHHDAVYQTVHHDEINHQAIDHYLVRGQYYTHVDAVYTNVEHPAVYQNVEHPAIFEIIEHPAVYLHHDLIPAVWEVITTGDTVVDNDGTQKMVDEAGNLIPTGNIVNTNPTFCSA